MQELKYVEKPWMYHGELRPSGSPAAKNPWGLRPLGFSTHCPMMYCDGMEALQNTALLHREKKPSGLDESLYFPLKLLVKLWLQSGVAVCGAVSL